jgi:YkoY family integral membrane protein
MPFLSRILDAFRAQTFEPGDLAVVGVLVVLEGLLSLDNTLVLGLLARRLRPSQRGKALTYGLAGAFIFRIIAVVAASWLLRSQGLMLVGGSYLLYLAAKHFFWDKKPPAGPIVVALSGRPICLPGEDADCTPAPSAKPARFWPTVLAIELTDIAVSVDSILAAVALVAQHDPAPGAGTPPKLWVVMTGGMLGVILMRFAAVAFIKLLARFPRFETAAYLLVMLIGFKLIAVWQFNPPGQPLVLDFHSPTSAAFWIFWGLMAAGFCVGFVPRKQLAVGS